MVKNDILKYVPIIFSSADNLRNKFKESEWASYMMPFYALILLESRIINEADRIRKEYEGEEETFIINEIKESLLKNKSYNSVIIEKNKRLKDICENDSSFIIDFETYLQSFDSQTKQLLGIDKDENSKGLDIRGKITDLKNKGKEVLFNFTKKWASVDLTEYNNSEITTLEEHIKGKWADMSADTAGEHYTPWDVIQLINELIVAEIMKYKEKINFQKYISIYDLTCGGGNMLFGVEDLIRRKFVEEFNKEIATFTYGQEINETLYALAKIESIFRDSDIKNGDTLKKDEFDDKTFNIIVSNVPFGVDWKEIENDVKKDKSGRYTYYPTTADGQLLFLQGILKKLPHKQVMDFIENTTNKVLKEVFELNISINVTNGSPLFSGDAGSGESNIRKMFLDNDNILSLIQLPKSMFFNTAITTYLWLMTSEKIEEIRKNKIQCIDASEKQFYQVMSKSKGQKRHELTQEGIKKIVETYVTFDKIKEDYNKIFDKEYFYYNKQSIQLHYKDINGKSINDILPSKLSKDGEKKDKSIVIKNIKQIIDIENKKNITFENDNIKSIVDFDEIENETLKEKTKRIQEYVNDVSINEFIIITDNEKYYYDTKKETIIKETANKKEELGNGIIKVSISYKSNTKTQNEKIEVLVELLPKYEKDYEIIPFQEIKNGIVNKIEIDDYLNKWVEQEYIKLDNTIGVEINFNKLFYKYEQLRSLDDIFNDIKKLEQEELELDNNIFDLSPIELSIEELKELDN